MNFMRGKRLLACGPGSRIGITTHFLPRGSKLAFRLGTMCASDLRATVSSRRSLASPRVAHVYNPIRGIGSAAFAIHFCHVKVCGRHHAKSVYLLTNGSNSGRCGDAIRRLDFQVPCHGARNGHRRVLFPNLSSIGRNARAVSLRTASSYKLPMCCCIGRKPTRVRKGGLMFAQVPPHDGFPLGIAIIT